MKNFFRALFRSKIFLISLITVLLPFQMALGVYIYLYPELPKISDLDKAELQIPLKFTLAMENLFLSLGKSIELKLFLKTYLRD